MWFTNRYQHRAFCSGALQTLGSWIHLAFCGGAPETYHPSTATPTCTPFLATFLSSRDDTAASRHSSRNCWSLCRRQCGALAINLDELISFLKHFGTCTIHWTFTGRWHLLAILIALVSTRQFNFLSQFAVTVGKILIYTSKQFDFQLQGATRPRSSNTLQPGPKSGSFERRRHGRLVFAWWLMATIYNHNYQSWGEGDSSAMGSVAVPAPWEQALVSTLGTKTHGQGPTACFGTSQRPHLHSSVVKRSLRRAQKRIQTQGMAWYRGQCLTQRNFKELWPGILPIASVTPTPATSARPNDLRRCGLTHSPRHHHFNCLVWNSGGLSAPRLDELRTWMFQNNISVGVFLETHWQYTSEWSDDHWHYIHSGDPSFKGQGILVITNRHFCNAHNLKWRDIIPGRLLHVKFQCGERDIDTIACYQHTCKRTTANQKDRDHWWQTLESTLRTLPSRNTFALVGDFNCHLPQCNAITGTGHFRWKGRLITGPSMLIMDGFSLYSRCLA